ncbi:Bax inhibitor-1/YccA family protein [Novosphingobium sp. BL-8H]|uniref:Bax inhibitor-1/YccA family protein n=1 Tax=Novosphingobium sp. BL-8H TaxID=3127640 RepID=UPI0037572AE9
MAIRYLDGQTSSPLECRIASRARFMNSVFLQMAFSVGLSAVAAYSLVRLPSLEDALVGPSGLTMAGWIIFLSPLALVLLIGAGVSRMSGGTARALLALYAVLVGFSLATALSGISVAGLFLAFVASAGAFIALAMLGGMLRHDFSGLGNFLMIALVGLIVAMTANLIIGSNGFDMMISGAGVVLFAALTAYDTQRLKRMFDSQIHDPDDSSASVGALTLYLDFLNLFLSLLRFTGRRR